MTVGVTVKLLNSEVFDAKIKDAISQVKNLMPEFTVIANMWYKDNKQIFDLKSAGQYEDFKTGPDGKRPTKYMLYKKSKVGGAYPLLKFSGKLAASILNSGAAGAVKEISATQLVLGTTIPYAIYHQLGTSKMPARPPIINKESEKHGQTNIFQKRLANYMRVISASVARRVARAIKRNGL